MTEKLAYTVAELTAMMGLSRATITHLFEKEPGVIILSTPTTLNKRRHRTIRIPHTVYARVLTRITNR